MATKQAVTEIDILAHLAEHPVTDPFLDQTIHVWQHGGTLTALGRLILEERIRVRNHRTDTRWVA